MVIVCVFVEPTAIPADGLLIDKLAISEPSTKTSLTTVKVTLPDV